MNKTNVLISTLITIWILGGLNFIKKTDLQAPISKHDYWSPERYVLASLIIIVIWPGLALIETIWGTIRILGTYHINQSINKSE